MTKTAVGLVIAVLLAACTSTPQPVVGKLHLKALTPVDGVVADALRAKGVTWDSGSSGAAYAGAIVDGDYTNAAGIQDLLKNTWGKDTNTVLFVDLDNLDDRPGLASALGFTANSDTYGVLYRYDTTGKFNTLSVREFPGAYSQAGDQLPLTTEQRQASAELFAGQVLQEVLPSAQGLLAQASSKNPTPTNQIPDGLPYVNLKLNETFSVFGTGKFMANRKVDTCTDYLFICAPASHFHDDWQDGNRYPVASVDYNESLWLFHDNYNKRYYVIGTPIINTTPAGLESNRSYKANYQDKVEIERERCGPGDIVNKWFGFSQVSWTPTWAFFDPSGKALGGPISTGRFTQINSLPPNTNNVKTVSTSSGVSIGFDASKDGPSVEGSYEWHTENSTEVADWEVQNNSTPAVQAFRWKSNSPGIPKAGPDYDLYPYKNTYDPNTLNKTLLSLAPTYAYQMPESDFPAALLVKFSLGGTVAAGIYTEADSILCQRFRGFVYEWDYAVASMDIQPAQRQYTLEPYQIIRKGGK
jgi:hypothetical protein